MALVVGVDCSTQATKALVVDTETGRTVASGRATHTVTGTDGARETHPTVWWDALAEALEQTGRAGEVAAIAIGGQQHGLVVSDASDEPLRASMLWNDTRSAPQAEELTAALGGPEAWAAGPGSVPVAAYTVTKWAWLRANEPAVAAAAASVRLPHDWLTTRMSGAAVTDRGDASGSGWYSTAAEAYDPAVLSLPAVDLDPSLLPRVAAPTEVVGTITSAAASALGLPTSAVVAPGTGDNMAAAMGLGVEPGVPVLSLGTSGTVYAVSDRRPGDPSGTVSGFADATGRYLPLACTLNCTLAVDRVATWLGIDRNAVADRTDVTMLPYLDGERTPNLPNASGAMLGLRHDTEPGEILLAAYQGAAASLVDAMDAIAEQSGGLDPDAPLVLIGGGAQGTAWRQVIGQLTGRRLLVPAADELVALGAAVQAAAALEQVDPLAVAARWKTQAGEELAPIDHDPSSMARIRAVAGSLFGAG
ncbi:Xylulose kinase [Euzebya pacifica]|uniref:Xylulose kinase n=1 Tax=Euzebya pacifica TaxID=1608957 RepID=A0A346XT06_9ACTN|nr:xylulokinase [Euzebya pacifica]AXV05353.1 Xylulose kinase [Euzebya pacifica]